MTQIKMSNLEESLAKYIDTANIPFVTSRLRSALGLSDDVRLNEYWVVGDHDKVRQLYSCHFTSPEHIQMLVDNSGEFSESDQRVLLGMRGVVVHIPNDGGVSRVVTRGFGYTPTATIVDNLVNHSVDGTSVHKFSDFNGGVHHIDFAAPTTYSTILSEGCVLRISKFNGEYLRTTNRKLNTERSRWGSSPLFVEMYKTFGGPELEELFGDAPSSNITHLFMVVHPALQVASRYPVGEGHLMYLGYVNNNPTVTVSAEELDACMAWKKTYNCVSVTAAVESEGGVQRVYPVCPPTVKCDGACVKTRHCEACTVGHHIIVPTVLDYAGVNHALSVGNSSMVGEDLESVDPRLRPGEAVIVQFVDAATGAHRIIRLCSVAHNWRTAVGNNQPNRYYQFVSNYSLVLAKDLKPKHPDGTPLHVVFDGQQGVNYTYDQFFPYVATPSPEQMRELAMTLADASSDGPDHARIVWDWMIANRLAAEDAVKRLSTYDKAARRDLRDVKLANIAACMLCALPYAHIVASANFYPTFIEQRDKVISYMCSNFSVFKGVQPPKTYKGTFVPGHIDFEIGVAGARVTGGVKLSEMPAFVSTSGTLNLGGSVAVRLYKTAADYVATRVQQGSNTKQGVHGARTLSVFEMATDNLRNLIFKEQGPTLYALLSVMSKHMNYVPKVGGTVEAPVPGAEDFPTLAGTVGGIRPPAGAWAPVVPRVVDALPADVMIGGDTM